MNPDTRDLWLRRIQPPLRWFTAANFIGVGLLHFVYGDVFVAMMPPYLPWHLELVWLSGVFEVIGGVGLLVPKTRRAATWGLLALLLAVFPANVHMAMAGVDLPIEGMEQTDLARWMRLPYQAVLWLQVWFVGMWTGAGAVATRD